MWCPCAAVLARAAPTPLDVARGLFGDGVKVVDRLLGLGLDTVTPPERFELQLGESPFELDEWPPSPITCDNGRVLRIAHDSALLGTVEGPSDLPQGPLDVVVNGPQGHPHLLRDGLAVVVEDEPVFDHSSLALGELLDQVF